LEVNSMAKNEKKVKNSVRDIDSDLNEETEQTEKTFIFLRQVDTFR